MRREIDLSQALVTIAIVAGLAALLSQKMRDILVAGFCLLYPRVWALGAGLWALITATSRPHLRREVRLICDDKSILFAAGSQTHLRREIRLVYGENRVCFAATNDSALWREIDLICGGKSDSFTATIAQPSR